MTRTVLGENAKTDIRESVKRCRSSREIAAEVDRLAAHYNVSRSRIYELTEDLRTKRKTRTDKGNRKASIATDPNLRLVAGWVLEYGISPSEAIVMGREQRGMDISIEFPTLVKYLRESGLDKRSRRKPNVPHRRFEASAPGEMFQFDISGVKERWYDHTTRRIISVSALEVSKNHENSKSDRTRVWRFALIDDYSRRSFIRYIGVAKPNSSHVVDFLLQAYAEMGVPHTLYTDNDAIIKFGRNQRTTQILNKVLLDQGGYQNTFHLPGNARATGKVERLHQTVEQCEKFIGIYIAERGYLSLEELNDRFAAGVMQKLNNQVHSETGQTPMQRWESTFSVIRRLDYATLRSAFMADEHEVKVRGDLTFRLKGQSFQLPTSEMYPFANWIGQKLRVVFADDQPFFTVIGLDGIEYDVAKEASAPDAAGDFKSTRQTTAEQLRKDLRAVAKEDAKRVKTGTIMEAESIRFFDELPGAAAAAAEPTGVLKFPKPETTIDVQIVEREAPGRVESHNPAINFWEAVSRFESRFASKSECKSFMDTLYESRDEESWKLQSEIEQALDTRSPSTARNGLRAVG